MGVGVAFYYDLKYNRKIQVLKDFSRIFQVLCPYYAQDHMKAMLHWQMCGLISQIWAQWIDYKTID